MKSIFFHLAVVGIPGDTAEVLRSDQAICPAVTRHIRPFKVVLLNLELAPT
jgi:hypothetical protein